MATKADEIAAIVQAIRDRVRREHPSGKVGSLSVPLPDLLPILHAKDAAESKAAAIGSVNPRPPGLANSLIQGVKRNVARALNWFVRDQVEFNRATLTIVETLLTALNDQNRTIAALAEQLDEIRPLRQELLDIRSHWSAWRPEWDKKLVQNEAILLRSAADLQAGFQHRLALLETSYRDAMKEQHGNFASALENKSLEMQQQVWTGLAELRKLHHELRLEHERMIHSELRSARQRPATPAPQASGVAPVALDYAHFANRFRGAEDSVRERMQFYVPLFREYAPVVDLGCGRGEFLELMRDAGVDARGMDFDVEIARSKGLAVQQGDFFELLTAEPESSLGGIFCSQVIEHLAPGQVPALIQLAAAKLRPGGLLAIETPDPACLAIFATHFYIDPTHTRPVPAPLTVFYMEEAGFGAINVHRLSTAVESMPSLASLSSEFREEFFGSLDYAAVGYRL